MNVSHEQKVGTFFKKENVYIAMVYREDRNTKEFLRHSLGESATNELVDKLASKMIVAPEQVEILYKTDDGYIVFSGDGAENIAGDNSDGKGKVIHLVSIWEYYSEDEVREAIVDDSFKAILVEDTWPLTKYRMSFPVVMKKE